MTAGSSTSGIHHVSVIAGDPQENVDTYTRVFGLPLIKQTVNADEKFMYHLYYGDVVGTPGTLFTVFPYQRGAEGRIGQPQPTATAFAIPPDSSAYWRDRLEDADKITVEETTERFGDTVLSIQDQDGQPLELVETDCGRSPVSTRVPASYAIRGLHSTTLVSTSIYHTAATLEVLGFEPLAQEGARVRYHLPDTTAGVMDLLDTELEYGREGIGTIHHVAFRAGDRSLEEWREALLTAGLEPTRIKDRYYFEAVYVREPGGILFEIATDKPGFTIDETPDDMGMALQLPPPFEPDREMIEGQLPKLVVRTNG